MKLGARVSEHALEDGVTQEAPSRRVLGLPRRLYDGLLRLKAWQLALLGAVSLVVVLWITASASATSVYTAQVVVTDGRTGIADPKSLFDFGDLPPTAAIEHTWTLKNEGATDTFVMVGIFGGIRDFIDIEDAFFTLDPGEERTVTVRLAVPPNAEAGKRYSGKVVVTRLPHIWP